MVKLLLDSDYEELEERSIQCFEEGNQRYIVFPDYPLPEGVYAQEKCDVLVIIPENYNQDGNDMFWTFPRLVRADGKPIPQTQDPGAGDNKTHDGKEFCRWSRHWNKPPSTWKPGKDNVLTILRRIEWAFGNPDADK